MWLVLIEFWILNSEFSLFSINIFLMITNVKCEYKLLKVLLELK